MPLQDAYLESQVLTADPMELVRLLYRAAGDATRSAGAHLAAGRIAERSRQISRAHAILTQLSCTLDHERGGTLSRSLAELYDYMQRRLLEANLRQKGEPLEEVGRLLATLLEGWDQIPGTREPGGPYGNPSVEPSREQAAEYGGDQSGEYGGYAAVFAPSAAAEYASQNWSF